MHSLILTKMVHEVYIDRTTFIHQDSPFVCSKSNALFHQKYEKNNNFYIIFLSFSTIIKQSQLASGGGGRGGGSSRHGASGDGDGSSQGMAPQEPGGGVPSGMTPWGPWVGSGVSSRHGTSGTRGRWEVLEAWRLGAPRVGGLRGMTPRGEWRILES